VQSRLDTAEWPEQVASVNDKDSCNQFPSADGLIHVMVIEGKLTRIETDNERLETSKGIHVGSTEAQLKRAYGSALKGEANHYGEGWDYYLWSGKDRGIRFYVSEGKVSWIAAGDETIRYIEGCA
jgi:hypothetical protein